MKKIAVVALMLLPVAAYAADQNVDPKLCQALVNYKEPAGVEYQPGVDVNGNKVVPADLPDQQQMKLPEKIYIPLTASLTKLLNLGTSYPASALGPGTEAQLGSFTVDSASGAVSFNGKPLTDDQQDKLAAACAKQK